MTSLFLRPLRRRARTPDPARPSLGLRSLVLAAVVAWTGTVLARSDDPLTLADALRLAEQRSARLLASDRAIAGASERAVSGAALPDPVLRAGIDNLPIAGDDRFSLGRDFMTMRRIGVMQEFTDRAKRQLRRERGEQAVALERAMRDTELATLRRDVALAWLDRAFAARAARLLESLSAEVRLQIQTLDAAIRSGRASATDLRSAQGVMLLTEDQLAASRQEERVTARMLERWLGEDAGRPVGELPDTGTLVAGSPEALASLTHHAEIAVSRAAEALAAADVRLAQRSLTPDWTVEVAYQQRGPGFADMVSFGVSIPLPLFAAQRQDREIRATRAALAQAQAGREDLERQHRAEARSLLEEWQGFGERIARLESALLPVANERITLALAAYRGGSGTLAQVLDARRAEIEARLQVLALQRDRARAWARLRYLSPADPRESQP